MKGKLFMLMAMMGMISNLPANVESSFDNSQRPKPKKVSPEEADAKFQSALVISNARNRTNFPRWTAHRIGKFEVVASNPKTAHKQLIFLLKSNGVDIKA